VLKLEGYPLLSPPPPQRRQRKEKKRRCFDIPLITSYNPLL